MRPEIHLVDGENLVARYQAMAGEGHEPKSEVIHKKDEYVWHPKMVWHKAGDIRRVTYYTSAVGSDNYIIELIKEIRTFRYAAWVGTTKKSGGIFAKVFKKPKGNHKSRAVDINIVIDSMTEVANRNAGVVCLYSGDSDFVPLIKELMRLGAEVDVKAFSSGLSPLLEISADSFTCLDGLFFTKGS